MYVLKKIKEKLSVYTIFFMAKLSEKKMEVDAQSVAKVSYQGGAHTSTSRERLSHLQLYQ